MEDAAPLAAYPVRLSFRYPERVSRVSTFFRLVLAVPVVIFLVLVGGASFQWGSSVGGNGRMFGIGSAWGVIFALWAAVLVRGRIPHWLFDFLVGLHRFTYRAYSYLGLLTDQYPAFEGDWVLNYEVDYPERISRRKLVVWKFISFIPHVIVLSFLGTASLFVIFIGWIAILFTGTFPRGLHAFVVGVMRWAARVTAYFESLTDAFPPYSLAEDAGPGSRASEVWSAIGGALIVVLGAVAAVVLAVFLVAYFREAKTVHVDPEQLQFPAVAADAPTVTLDHVSFRLVGVSDAPNQTVLAARPQHRLIEFVVQYASAIYQSRQPDTSDVQPNSVRIRTSDANVSSPILLTIDQIPAPMHVLRGAPVTLRAFFEIPDKMTVEEVQAYPNPTVGRHVAWRFTSTFPAGPP
ncbi:MAG: DUF4389 domain-containing protein [Dehalococcoidia bacterium]